MLIGFSIAICVILSIEATLDTKRNLHNLLTFQSALAITNTHLTDFSGTVNTIGDSFGGHIFKEVNYPYNR